MGPSEPNARVASSSRIDADGLFINTNDARWLAEDTDAERWLAERAVFHEVSRTPLNVLVHQFVENFRFEIHNTNAFGD